MQNFTKTVPAKSPQAKQVTPAAPRPRPRPKARPKGKVLTKVPYTQGNAPGFKSLIAPSQQVGSGVMIVDTLLQKEGLEVALATFFSNVLLRNVIGANEQVLFEIVRGMAWLLESIVTIASGATANVVELPIIFDLLIALLKKKKIFLENGTIHYTPNWGLVAPQLHLAFTTPTDSIYCLTSPGVNNLMPINFSAISGTVESYAEFLRVASDETFKSWGNTIVKTGTSSGPAYNDPSAYARNYTYFGTAGYAVGGFYSVSEIEVPFNYPMFSKFSLYDTDDKVISRVFHPQSGGISTPVGLSLASKCNAQLMKNPIPCHYKFIDFYQLYAVIMGWVVAVLDDIPTNLLGDPNNIFTTPRQFGFSQSDFLLLLRQAVLFYFPEQCHGQFVSPVRGVPSNTNSVFEPFIVDTIGTPMDNVAGMILPAFIVENLNMLKGRVVSVETTPNARRYKTIPKKLAHNFMPVWGVYSNDTPPSYQFNNNGAPIAVFSPVDKILDEPDLWDLQSRTSPLNKVNINLTVGELIVEWNNFCTAFAKSRSTKLSPLSGDVNVAVNLLSYSRVFEKVDVNDDITVKNPYIQPIDRYIINGPSARKRIEVRSKSEKGKPPVKSIPPATYNELKCVSVLSVHALSQNVVGAMNFFILPSIRLNPSGPPSQDLLTLTGYQTVTGELCQVSNRNPNGALVMTNETERTTAAGVMFHSGFAPGDANNDTLTSAVNIMAEHGQSIDFLKSLFGGLASIIPVVGPIVSGLINGS